ncbi:FadR/GntR family transcriptional regulator [Roseomonas marmotae]|uniref:FadR family transcriptional regulator n=1 Tax=Roseomonas marmotae TaxID=2768161 RepID=A0ABS3KH17_9PROT|nr:FCD domain-containing protein [Roseomonas marmotae]MBO1075903.1 FadR family transcriptional regulator [Roseomonas marmotae]QTI81914.1 FadR family transcriptional regulator [Roseomonas marmotae]
MEPDSGLHGTPVMTLLQAYLASIALPASGRLPPERELAEALGVSRAELRKALAMLEAEGQLWRHVGKGTFLGPRPLAAIGDVAHLARQADATDMLNARLALEPQLAALAARNAKPAQLEAMRAAMEASRRPGLSWRGYEGQDARLHREIASAAGNPLLLHLFDQLAAIRRVLTWDRPRPQPEGPPPGHPSFAEHEQIVAAIATREAEAAAAHMHDHIAAVHRLIAQA